MICLPLAVFILLGLFLQIHAAFSHSSFILDDVEVISEEEWNEIVGSKTYVDLDFSTLSYNGGSPAYVEEERIVYLPQQLDSSSWEGVLTCLNDAELMVLNHSTLYDRETALQEGTSFSCLAVTKDTYSEFFIVFTGVSTVQISYNDEEDLTDKTVNHDGVITIQGTDGSYTISDCVFHVRGDWTLNYYKKNYKIELKTKEGENNHLSLLGMRSDDDWMLNAMYSDGSRVREPLAYALWEEMQILSGQSDAATSHMVFVEVFLNDVYRGLYVLQEPVDAKTFNLEEGDFLYKTTDREVDSWAEGITQYNGQEEIEGADIKWPKDSSLMDWSILESLYDFDERSITLDELEEQGIELDTTNLALFNLFVFLTRAEDTTWKNIFFVCTNEGDGTYLIQQYPWDLNASFGDNFGGDYTEDSAEEIINKYGEEANQSKLWLAYRDSCPEEANELICSMWSELRDAGLSSELVCSMLTDLWSDVLSSGAVFRDADRWPDTVDGNDYTNMLSWIERRFATMDSYFGYTAQEEQNR